MTSSSSLYGSTQQSGTVSSSNYTTLYSGGNTPPPNGNLVIPGTLTVNGCAILTNCNSFSLLPTTAETILFGGASTLMTIGSSSGTTTINNQLATANYAFPVADGVAGQVLVTDGAGVVSFAAVTTVGKTYNIDAGTTTGGANLNLTSDIPTTDTVKFANGTGISIVRTDANTITITNTDPGTAGVTSITGTANQVIASASTGAVTLSTPQSIATTSSPTFASLTLTGDLDVRGSDITNSTGGINITTTSNNNILLDPDGSGRVQVNADIEATGNGNFNGTVIINNDQTVTNPAYQAYSGATLGSLTWDGTSWAATGGINSDGGRFGNVTVGIATDQTISTISGNLEIDSATNQVNIQALTYIDSDLTVNNGTVKTNSGNAVLFNTTATTVDAFGAATTINLGAATGTTTINHDLDVKGGDITNSTGALAITSGGTNTNITLTPNGTGDVVLSADTVQIGDLNTNAALTTNGTGDLVLNTNNGTNSGQITILNGANGNMTLVPNGTGNVVNTFSNGGNLTNNRNYVLGAIRNATTAGNGEVFTLGPAGTGFKGISLDNSADTTDGITTLLRSFTGGAVAAAGTRGRVIFERARGTSASPTAVQAADQLGSVEGTGYTSTGWLADTLAVMPAVFNFSAAENWVSNTNIGTTSTLLLAPTATTISTGANLVPVITVNPQTFACRSDAYTWSNGKTGTTQRMALDVSGNLTVSGDLTVTGNDIKNSGGSNVISMSTDNSNTSVNTTLLTLTNPTTQTSYGGSSNLLINAGNPGAASFNDRISQLRVQTASSTAGDASTITFNTGNFNTGTNNFSATVAGNTLGEFFFSGNYGTSTSFQTLGPSVRFQGKAAENFSATNSGGRFVINLDKIGGSTPYDAFTIDSSTANIGSDIITLENNSGTDFVVIDANTAKFNVPVTTEITTTTISEGTTYTPAATVDNNISVQINTLAGGTTVIDLASLTGNSRGASYNILLFNNTASGTPIQVKNTRINTNNLTTHTITAGDRIIVNAYIVGDYATADHLLVA